MKTTRIPLPSAEDVSFPGVLQRSCLLIPGLTGTIPQDNDFEEDSTRSPLHYPSARIDRIGDELTPLKSDHLQPATTSRLLNPPGSHKRLLQTSTITRSDKGKGRAIEQEVDSGVEQPSETTKKIPALARLSNFKVPVTPNKQAPSSGLVDDASTGKESPNVSLQHNSYQKPLKTLGAITGLSSLPRSDLSTTQGTETPEVKPRWAQLLESDLPNTYTTLPGQHALHSFDPRMDLTELLSPRKKRKGWQPAGYAERASEVIKRTQTANNLWIHEISRLLDTFNKKNDVSSYGGVKRDPSALPGSRNGTNPATKVKEKDRLDGKSTVIGELSSYDRFLRDLNPHLRLEILETKSAKPASLTWSSADGGFITAGAAEKLLITRCRILPDDSELAGKEASQTGFLGDSAEDVPHPSPSIWPLGANLVLPNEAGSNYQEGLVVFTLNAHSRTSTGITLARKEQQRPNREPTVIPRDGEPPSEGYHSRKVPEEPGAEDREDGQSRLHFSNNDIQPDRKYTAFVPASIADLHTQIRVGDQIWCWEPWSVVDLVEKYELLPGRGLDFAEKGKVTASSEDKGNGQDVSASQKALLVSKFAVLL